MTRRRPAPIAAFGPIVVSLLAAQIGGCAAGAAERGCHLAGCDSGLQVRLYPLALVLDAGCARGPLAARTCVDDFCTETPLSPSGTCRDNATPSGPRLTCRDTPVNDDLDLRMSFGANAGYFDGPHTASVALRAPSGETIYEERRAVWFTRFYPNGVLCQPLCWQAPPMSFDVRAALAGFEGRCDAGGRAARRGRAVRRGGPVTKRQTFPE